MALLIAILPSSSAASDEITAYNGWIGADSPLYGLKLFFQEMGESMAGNASAKLTRQMAHAEERLSEACAMTLKNNSVAAEAALNQYIRALGRINATLDDPEVDEGTYAGMSWQFEKHQNHFRYMINDSALTGQSRNRWANAFNYSEQFREGRPFIYSNDTMYFVPPGQMDKMKRSSMPPGLGKKGFESPAPILDNGRIIWPWDEGYNHSYDFSYQYGNGTGAGLNNFSFNHSYNYEGPGLHGNGSCNSAQGNSNGNGNGKK